MAGENAPMTEPNEGSAASSPPESLVESGHKGPALTDEISPELFNDPFGEEVLDVSNEDFEAMLAAHRSAGGDVREGQIVQASVLRVTESSVILEFGFKSEGSVPLDEFKEPDAIEPGQVVEVLLESLEDEDGVVVLSKKKADFLRVWDLIREAYDNGEPVEGLLTRKIKGGVTVDIMGVDAFLPGSQIALRRVPDIEDLIGQTYHVKIIKLNKRRRNIVVSRRVILEEERKDKRATLVKELLTGQVREGVVKNITDFGAFIDLGGLDGLLHITDMSWGRVGHPSSVVSVGERLDIKVLDIDWDRDRISLGLKQLRPYPWTDIEDRYPVGSRVLGRVVSITNYGAFVELQKGVEGLVHISEMAWTRNVRHPSKLVAIGDEIEVVVLKVDPKGEKISLGMKQTQEDPWLSLPVKYPVGTTITGKVRNLTSFGAFVEIEKGIDGLVHVSDMSWVRRVEHPSEVVQKGTDVDVMVLDIDGDNKRISLGIKQLIDDPWPSLLLKFVAGHEQDARVVRVQERGLLADLGEGVQGFVPSAHAGLGEDPIKERFGVGDKIRVRVLATDASDRRIVLEVLAVEADSPEDGLDNDAPTDGEAAEPEQGGEAEPEADASDDVDAEAGDAGDEDATDDVGVAGEDVETGDEGSEPAPGDAAPVD